MTTNLQKNDKVIWDSGYGYDIGYFIGEGNSYNTYLIDMKTGIVRGECSYPKNKIYKHSDQLEMELKKKYGY
jgi:hypothetical protein